MSRKLPVVSGKKLVKLLAREGFEIRRQSSSHIVLQKGWRVFQCPFTMS